MLTEEVKNKLNKLIEINLDASKGYRDAATGVSNADLQRVFNAYSVDREKYANILKTYLVINNENPTEGGSFIATAHRALMTLKGDVFSNNEKVLLEEIIRGEETAVEVYQEVMPGDQLPHNIQNIVVKQYNQIYEALRQMKEWKKIFEHESVIS